MSSDGIRINVSIDDRQVAGLLSAIEQRTGNARPALLTIGEIVRSSIARNFAAGGRPAKWPASARSAAQAGQPLSDTGRLRRSFTVQADRRSVAVGTNVVYAAVHNFGSRDTVQVRAHTRTIPRGQVHFGRFALIAPRGGTAVQVKAHSRKMNIAQREFMLVQDEDWAEMLNALSKFIIRGQ